MSPFSFALITPTFAGDYAQFSLLAHTVERHVPESVPHYVIVPSGDYRQFARLQSKRTRLLIEDSVLPDWVQGFLTINRYRVTTRSLPIRGWVLQQLLKLSMPAFAPEDVYLFVDSDVAFLKDFDPARMFVHDGKVRLFCEQFDESWPIVARARGQRWRRVSQRLLGARQNTAPRASYVGNVISWRRDVVLSLQRHLDRGWGRSWQERIARCPTCSEYMLYGQYVENVLGYEAAGHYLDDTICALEAWEAREQSVADLRTMRDQRLADHHVALMVSAKGHTPADRIDQVFNLRSPRPAPINVA